jgi:hypothetical protein
MVLTELEEGRIGFVLAHRSSSLEEF